MEWGALASLFDVQSFDFVGVWSSILETVKGMWAEVSDHVKAAREIVEPVAWVVGSILALVPGTFAIYKWIYYRRSRLPERLDDLLREEEQRLRTARDALLERVTRSTPLKASTAPIFVNASLSRAMQQLGWSSWWHRRPLSAADKNLDSALFEIDQQMMFWDGQHAHYKRQQAAAHLLKGAIAVTRAEEARAERKDATAHDRAALSYFLKALEVDETDIQALEYAAHQHKVLGELDDALPHYEQLVRLTSKPGAEAARVRMHALRYLGEIYEQKYDKNEIGADLRRAKESFEAAIEAIPAEARGELDEAFVLRGLASVEDKRGTANLPFLNCDAAERIFLDLIRRKQDVATAEAGLKDVRELRKRIVAHREAAASTGREPVHASGQADDPAKRP
jgi:tetratricopeptide (TPR) repeat protein